MKAFLSEQYKQENNRMGKTRDLFFMGDRWGNSGNSDRLYFGKGGAPKSLQLVTAAMKLKDACSLEEKL